MLPAQASLYRTDRYEEALRALSHLTNAGEIIYSPIVHFHMCAGRFALPTDASYWEANNRCMIYPAKEVLILKNAGWEFSRGVAGERKYAEHLGKPICFVELLIDGGVRRIFDR